MTVSLTAGIRELSAVAPERASLHAEPCPRSMPMAVNIRGLAKWFVARRSIANTLLHPRRSSFVHVLRDLSLDVEEGELFGLLGPNGAGKTTLFKILSTLIVPDAGTASICGADLIRDSARVRSFLTPVIADERSLSWRVTAWENLHLHGTLQGLGGGMLRRRIEEVLDIVGLQGTGAKLVGQFSSGMKQRLLIARALLHRPRVLLLDEPTRSLDPITAREFRAFLRSEIIEGHGCTVLLATHDPEEALEFCDRIAILDRGRLIRVGSPQSLASEFRGTCYRVWTTTPDHSAFGELLHQQRIESIRQVDRVEDLACLEMNVLVEEGTLPDVVSFLVTRGARLSRFERIGVGLADVIERAISVSRKADNA